MEELTKSQRGRFAIRIFKTVADALALRGYYRPSGRSGQTLADSLKMISPEIYGTMNDPRIIELKGLEYVVDRLPCGIETYARIVLTAQEDLAKTSFKPVIPLKRRRISYRVSDREICFVITRGLSEIYDILTHITFLTIESGKIYAQMKDRDGNYGSEWKELERFVHSDNSLSASQLDAAVWNLSIILGRTYQETFDTYSYLEKNRKESGSNRGLFHIIYDLGKRMQKAVEDRDERLLVYFTPSLKEMIGRHQYAKIWVNNIRDEIARLGLQSRPLHIISANMHSIVNALYGYGACKAAKRRVNAKDFYSFIKSLRDSEALVHDYASNHGMVDLKDESGAQIDCQLIDCRALSDVPLHPKLGFKIPDRSKEQPVILVMDYAFGTQAFEVMDELLGPMDDSAAAAPAEIKSISIMGKAGILPGKKGDIMLATAHVIEGTADNYYVDNDLVPEDFDDSVKVYVGPIVTVLGTSLQNRDVLLRFQNSSWHTVGLEMEGGHYQRAISAAKIRRHIPADVKVRYAYYASDNPLQSGETLASGAMGSEGIKPTYMISNVILKKIIEQV
jgi:hypothetical protein